MLQGICFNSHTVCYAHELNENKNLAIGIKSFNRLSCYNKTLIDKVIHIDLIMFNGKSKSV